MTEPTVEHAIPPMTHPLGAHWRQPPREAIEIDDEHALMSEATMRALPAYYPTIPSGVYAGKMWRRQGLLCWFADEPGFPDKARIEHRVILTVEDAR